MEFQFQPNNTAGTLDTIGLQPMEFQFQANLEGSQIPSCFQPTEVESNTITLDPRIS